MSLRRFKRITRIVNAALCVVFLVMVVLTLNTVIPPWVGTVALVAMVAWNVYCQSVEVKMSRRERSESGSASSR